MYLGGEICTHTKQAWPKFESRLGIPPSIEGCIGLESSNNGVAFEIRDSAATNLKLMFVGRVALEVARSGFRSNRGFV